MKNFVSKKIKILNFEISGISDTQKYIIRALKEGKIGEETLEALIDSTEPRELLPIINFIRLKIGKRRSFRLAESFFDKGKYHQNETHDLKTSRDYLELATELYPEDAIYPNEAGVLSLSLKEYEKARDFFITAMSIMNKTSSEKLGLAKTQNNLGNCFLRLEKFEPARKYFIKARRNYLKLKHYRLDMIVNNINIASVYWKEKQYKMALNTLSETIQGIDKVEFNSHPNYIQRERNLFHTLCADIARKFCEIKLDIYHDNHNKNILPEALEHAKEALGNRAVLQEWGWML